MEFKSILVPVRGDKTDDEAMKLACDLIRPVKGKVLALYVIEVERGFPLDAEVASATAKGEGVLEHIEQIAKGQKLELEAELLQARDVGPAVVQEAVERGVEAIVMSLPYKRRYGSFTLGEAVPYILRNAPCQVILWREAMDNNSGRG